jgi:3-oxoacyl-[acyl-carrier-protein] synthase-3
MSNKLYSAFKASGSYIPEMIVKNEDFLERKFYTAQKELMTKPNAEIISKFQEITCIKERRYVTNDLCTSDIAYFAAKNAFETSGIDPETIDYVIVAHNFGDVRADNRRSEFVPSLAARVKQKLGIKNPFAVAYDIAFGCPGWLQAVIQADFYIRSGQAKRALVIGAESLSRISDPADIDSMIYSDGAGAVIIEGVESEEPIGILTHATRSDTLEHAKLLVMSESYDPNHNGNDLFLKMNGHKLYKYALSTVPGAIKLCLDKAKLTIYDIKKVLIHQANEKMDEEILNRLFSLYEIKDRVSERIKQIMPMTISWLGNSSVATLPTLYDQIMKNNLAGHQLRSGEHYIFASVGAGMNVNCMIYKMA